MQKTIINTNKLFKTETALKVLPKTITVWHDLKKQVAKIDIIINGFRKPELTNATALNYLLLEDKIPINVIIVESSGDENIFNQLIKHNKVSKILVEDHKASHPEHGAGSYGMSISSAVGFYFSKSPYVFFSHNDMIALKKDFLEHLLSKLNEKTRIASFTQRHVIPFTGCMLIDRNLVTDSETDWLLYDNNPYIERSKFLQDLCSLKENKPMLKCDWIDSGEALIYEEIAKGNNVFVAASFGGTKGLWKTTFDLLGITKRDVEKIGNAIIYENLTTNKKEFKKRYKFVLRAGKKWENIRWFLSKRKNYWRYSINENNDLIFIHHGRGTRRTINRWMKFVHALNKSLSED
ncbi:MAG: hypothetical protein L3J35_04520 [Bacteroidales bacterium]|nr:hypothetical protein [Bacteroidales bacterium]